VLVLSTRSLAEVFGLSDHLGREVDPALTTASSETHVIRVFRGPHHSDKLKGRPLNGPILEGLL